MNSEKNTQEKAEPNEFPPTEPVFVFGVVNHGVLCEWLQVMQVLILLTSMPIAS